MGLISGLIRRLIKVSIYFCLIAAALVFIPNLPPYTKFTSISLEPPQPRTGPLAPNQALNNGEKEYLNKLLGPETFQVYKGDLYTGLATGEMVKISPGGHVTFVTKLGQPCTGLSQEHICGRPLGFQIDEENNVMYVADAYHGIWKVDLKTDKKQLLVSPRVAIGGREPKLINSIVLSKNGDFFWTDSSSDYQLKDGAMTTLSDPSGRLFLYNAAKNQSKVLLDDLWFPNGVTISTDNQFVVVAESYRFRLLKYFIDGPKKGKSEVFVAGLPGVPDNIRALPDGSGILVGLYVTYDDENPILSRPLAGTPLFRKLLARVQRLVEIAFEHLNNLYPNVIFSNTVYNIGHFKSISEMLPKQSGLVVVDWNGNIIESYYNLDGSLGSISDAIVYNNKLYIGTPHLNNFIGSVPAPPLLKKAFANKAGTPTQHQAKPVEAPKPKVEVKREAPKPVVQEKQTKPVVQEKQAKPVVQEKQAKPIPQEKQAKPVVQEKQAKPIPQEKQAKPVVQEKQAKPVAQEKQAKPVVQEKQAKPVAQEKQAKPVAQEKQAKPVVQEKQAKPVAQEKQAKPVPQEKQAKPVVQEKQVKPVAQEKQAKPVAQEKQARPIEKPAQATQPKQEKPTPKPTAKPITQTPPKKAPEVTTPKPQVKAKPSEPEPEFEMPIITRPKEEALNEIKNKLAPKNIPITEEIPSDTTKPSKETLKVIKKEGPVEIPNPHL